MYVAELIFKKTPTVIAIKTVWPLHLPTNSYNI